MLRLILLGLACLIDQAPSTTPDAPPTLARGGPSPAQVEALAKYNGMMAKPPESAAAHWKMALWCEQNGLMPEAYLHFGKVIELDPSKEGAWQKLGFKKVGGRWMTDEQVAIEASQKKADKDWSAKFKKWHKELHSGKKQAEALEALDKIADPAAVPSIYREFCGGGGVDQEIALRLLGQIDGPVASKVIAILALYGKTPNVRRHATELLRGRPPEEFLEMLVSFMKDTISYEVRPVGGPGSPGILFVEGERFNVRRFYAPPAVVTFAPRPGDSISYDENGYPVITRTQTLMTGVGSKIGVPGSKTLVTEREQTATTTETFSYANAMIEAQRSALTAKAQLEGDIAQIDRINDGLRKFNDLVMSVAQAATGKSPGPKAKDWRDLLAKGRDARYTPRTTTKPTLDENIPLAYLPDLSAAMTYRTQMGFTTKTIADS